MVETGYEGLVPEGYVSLVEFADLVHVNIRLLRTYVADGSIPPNVRVRIQNRIRPSLSKEFIDSSYAKIFSEEKTGRGMKLKPKEVVKLKEIRKKEKKGEPILGEDEDVDNVFDDDLDHSKDYWKIQNERVKALKSKLELQQARGEVISIAKNEELLKQIAVTVKQSILAIPDRLAPQLVGESDVRKIRTVLGRELREALSSLAKMSKITGTDLGIK